MFDLRPEPSYSPRMVCIPRKCAANLLIQPALDTTGFSIFSLIFLHGKIHRSLSKIFWHVSNYFGLSNILDILEKIFLSFFKFDLLLQ